MLSNNLHWHSSHSKTAPAASPFGSNGSLRRVPIGPHSPTPPQPPLRDTATTASSVPVQTSDRTPPRPDTPPSPLPFVRSASPTRPPRKHATHSYSPWPRLQAKQSSLCDLRPP